MFTSKKVIAIYWRKSIRHAWNLSGTARDLQDLNRQAHFIRRDSPTGLIGYTTRENPPASLSSSTHLALWLNNL